MEQLAETAGWLFGWLLRNSAHAAILAVVVWSLERTVLRRLPPRWRYGLWLLVFARLLLPIAPASPLSLFNLVDLAPRAIARITVELLGLPAPMPATWTEVPHPLADTPSWFLVALALWLPGAAVLAGLLWRDHRRLRHALRHTTPVTDSYILDLLQQSKAVMRVRRHVLLEESEHVRSPAISGLRRPRILLPTGLLERLTTDEIRFLFLHELAHVKRGDLGMNWVLAVVQVLHWFNPVVWYSLRRIVSVREEVCDECVLRSCFAGAAREYGLTLLHLLEECAPRRIMPALIGILDDVRTLRRRMFCIRTFGQSDAHPWIPAGITVALAIAGLTENQHHHPLILSASPQADLKGYARPHPRARALGPGTLRTSPRKASEVERAREEQSTPQRSTLRTFSMVFRDAVDDVLSQISGKPSAVASEAAPQGRSFVVPANPVASAPSPAAAPTAARVAPAGRPFPLPPVGQRGDILRPRKMAGAETDSVTPSGRIPAPMALPYPGRPPAPVQTASYRHSS